jgi:putative membrane protein
MKLAADLVQHWSVDPVLLGVLAAALALYLNGIRRRGAGGDGSTASGWGQRAAFLSSVAAFLVAACSPLDYYSAYLFWAHMIQHLFLLVLVPALLVLGAPWLPIWNGLPSAVRQRLKGPATAGLARPFRHRYVGPACALASFLLFIAGMWLWHWPPLYDLALNNEIIHDYGEHNTFLLVGTLFWLQVIPSPPFRPALGYVGRGLYMLAAIAQNVVLSMIIGFAPTPLYAPYADLASRPGGISALVDQQAGAAIMWSVGDLPYALTLMILIQVWLYRQLQEPVDDEPAALAAGRSA